MPTIEDHLAWFASHVFPLLPPEGQTIIEGSLDEGDPEMALDHCLQFSLIQSIGLAPGVLDSIEKTVRQPWFDPELLERTLGWIAQHRERNRAAAA